MSEPEQDVEEVVKPAAADDLTKALTATVFIRGANRPFSEMTREDAQFRGAELKSAAGWGPTAKVGSIARGWKELAIELERAGVETVGELPPETVLAFAPKLWVVPPRGSLL
jgi:hypothetical protein